MTNLSTTADTDAMIAAYIARQGSTATMKVSVATKATQSVRFQCEAIIKQKAGYEVKQDHMSYIAKRCEKTACENGLCAAHAKNANKYLGGYDRVGDSMYPYITFTKAEIAARGAR